MSFCFTNPDSILTGEKLSITSKTFNLNSPFDLTNQWIILRNCDDSPPDEFGLTDLEFFYTAANGEDHEKMLFFFQEILISVSAEEGDLLMICYKDAFFIFYQNKEEWLICKGFFDFTNVLTDNRIIYQGCIENT